MVQWSDIVRKLRMTKEFEEYSINETNTANIGEHPKKLKKKKPTVAHVGDQILQHIHVGQGINLDHVPTRFFLPLRVDVAQASEGILPVDVHGARSTDPLSTGPTEGKRGILFGFDFDQGIQDHWAAVVEVHGISGEVLEIRPTREQRYPI